MEMNAFHGESDKRQSDRKRLRLADYSTRCGWQNSQRKKKRTKSCDLSEL